MKDSYDERSPITDEWAVLVETVENEHTKTTNVYKMDFDTGYHTYADLWLEGNTELLDEMEGVIPKFVADAKVISNGIVWYPLISINYYYTLTPIPNNDNGIDWAVFSLYPVISEDEIKDNAIITIPITHEGETKMGLFKVSAEPIKVCKLTEFSEAWDLFNELTTEATNGEK